MYIYEGIFALHIYVAVASPYPSGLRFTKVLQRFNINGDINSVSTPLAPYFKLKATISPTTIEKSKYMTRVPYASAVGSLIYAMVCTRPDLS